MVIMFDGPVTPDDATEFVREVPSRRNLTLLREFPVRYEDDNTVDFSEIVRTNRTAKYRSFDGRIHVSKRDAASERRVRLAPLSSSLSEGELERLNQEFARLGGSNERARVRAIYNDAEQLIREAHNRLELAWGDTLTDGALAIAELGQVAEYGIPGNHLVAPATAWTDTTNATVLTHLRTWADVWKATNGYWAGRAKTSLRMLRLAQRNKEVIDAVYGATQGRTRVTVAELNDLLRDENLPVFDEPYDSELSVDDVTTRTIPDDRVCIMPTDLEELGHTAMGVSATALELANSDESDVSFENEDGLVAGGFVCVVIKDGPPFREYVFVDGVGQPVLDDAKKLLVADVA
jgi:hypothetical protein